MQAMETRQDGPEFRPTPPSQRLPVPARRLPVYRCDVLVVGSGVAGLCAALSAADEGAHVMVLSKSALEDGNTRYAQGGIAAAIGSDDRPEFHAGDTLAVGCGLADPGVVEAVTSGAPEAIQWLLRAGMQFDRSPEGGLSLGREGGHRVARILHHGTATGLELQRVLSSLARAHGRVDLYERVTAVDLLHDAEGRIGGLLALDVHGRPEAVLFEADVVILATGGAGQIYRETTNPQLASGDGIAMALRAGAALADLEFVQFHPTILYLAGAARFLISEVVRGAGAVLRDRTGAAFMAEYHPDRELAPRDVVSRAIFRRMVQTGDTHVYLDFSAVADAAARFPALARITREFGIDIRKDPIPVRPAVHYFVGGVLADLEGRSSQEGLWAAGECASTGFHGANRLGSNSLLEGLVHGRMVGRAAAGSLGGGTRRRFLLPRPAPARSAVGAELNLTDLVYSLKSLMWRQVGIERTAAGLSDALERIGQWDSYLARLGPFTPDGVEAVNMVQVAYLVARAALFREESRGTHFRTDYPHSDEAWRVHTRLHCDAGRLRLHTAPAVLEARA
ncbi:MAG: L-aspartate oxidase [Planctomycetota bacterium]|nr:MAG: L-aspartate oxidase [Planctomycetota bacterium]